MLAHEAFESRLEAKSGIFCIHDEVFDYSEVGQADDVVKVFAHFCASSLNVVNSGGCFELVFDTGGVCEHQDVELVPVYITEVLLLQTVLVGKKLIVLSIDSRSKGKNKLSQVIQLPPKFQSSLVLDHAQTTLVQVAQLVELVKHGN